MTKNVHILLRWKGAALFALGLAALVFAVHHAIIPSFAQEQQSQPEQSQKKPEPEATKTEELPNSACMDCHNPDILKLSKEELADQVVVDEKAVPANPKPPYVTGTLNLAIDEKMYAAGVHADTTCVTCHKGVGELPHKQRLQRVDCKECHEDPVETIKKSAHGDQAGPKAPACIGCHDVHYGKGQSSYGAEFQLKACVACHKASGLDPEKGHKGLYEAKMHLKLDCMLCHAGKQPGVHNIPAAKSKTADCQSCHAKDTILSKTKAEKPAGFFAYIQKTGFINADALKKFNYVVGANRIPALDTIIILFVLAPFGLPIVHGGLRILTRRKEPLHLPEGKILLHPAIERIWHWVQALCIVMLIITGVMIHWPESFNGWFEWAVKVHNWFGWTAVIFFGIWLVYNLVTGRISHYFPKKGEIPTGMIKQARFYGYGIFKHEPHPYAPSEDNKFNPLQKIAYLQFQVFLMPILLLSGVLYMYPETFKGVIDAMGGMATLATIHYILGGLFAAFLVAHLYLATTGETIGENFKAIITGYGIKSDHGEHH